MVAQGGGGVVRCGKGRGTTSLEPSCGWVLAAVQRAVRHAPRPGDDASTAAVLAHLGVDRRSAAARRARAALARLEAVAMLVRSRARGRTCWRLAARGHIRLRLLLAEEGMA